MDSGPANLGAALFFFLFLFIVVYGFFFFLSKGKAKTFFDLIGVSIFSFLMGYVSFVNVFDRNSADLNGDKDYRMSLWVLPMVFAIFFGGLVAVILLSPVGRMRWKMYVPAASAALIAGIAFVTVAARPWE